MKVTFPHMGYLYVPLRAFFSQLGIEVVVPPPISQDTINLGTRYSPEFACLPLKINIGNFLQAAELGADTVVMAGGIGPCRFGYYAQVQKEILADLGIHLDMIVLEPPQGHWRQLFRGLKSLAANAGPVTVYRAGALAWAKLKVLDKLAKNQFVIRAREKVRGSTTQTWRIILDLVDQADSVQAVYIAAEQGQKLFDRIVLEPHRDVLKVGLVGEIYTLLEPAVNLEIERLLGEMGVEVVQSVYLSNWVMTNLVLHTFHLRNDGEHYQLAAPYLGSFVGGHGLETISTTIFYARSGLDGVIHLAPLTCMPEIVAKSILPQVSVDEDIPVLTFMLDEHSAEAGIQTRLEAFYELLKTRKQRGHKNNIKQIKNESTILGRKSIIESLSWH
ncbi:MAG: CoA protein activase [Firmicutes bacterium]|jgi:predicted nucleotide-binding protein (sugar kinase/HSP70/actin superfamily)|nr:CoA protein activase [Bacillota bacterium]